MDSDDANDSAQGKRNGLNSKKARTRVSRACDRCRTKKDKCDGRRPSCSVCIAIGHACSYDPSTKKRGLPEGYVRGLEKLWALCLGKINGLEEVVVDLLRHQDEVESLWNHETAGEELHASWKGSSVLRELEALLSKLEATANESAGKRKREREESTSEGILETTFHRTLEYAVQPLGISTTSRAQVSIIDGRSDGPTPSESVVSFPARTPALLDLYFSHTHCWFPILERHHILRTSYSCSSGQRRPESISSADLAILWAVLAYADQQYVHISSEIRPSGEVGPAGMLIAAMKWIPPLESGIFEIGHVQALLLVALNSIGSHWNKAWIIVGHAVRIAMDINVVQVHGRGKHVLFGCFILDTLVSARLERRPHMRREDIEPLGHLEEDGLEEWDPWTNSMGSVPPQGNARGPAFTISCFNRLCDVCAILSDILCSTSSGMERRSFCQQQSENLDSLFKKLPFIDQSTSSSLPHGPPHSTYLALTYFAAQLAVNFHARSTVEQRPSDAFARNACEILVLLTQHAQSVGLVVLPPFLEYTLRLSVDGATLARSDFSDTAGLPTFTAWVHKMDEHVHALKTLWPVFNSLSDTLADGDRQGERSLTIPTTHATFRRNEMGLTPTSMSAPIDKLVTPRAASSIIAQPNLNFWEGTSSSAVTSTRDQLPASFDMMMTEMKAATPTPSNRSMPAGLAMPQTPQTSPSFQGDDVDAIFHDLAHLDTTEWTNSREQGLREFGFADDSTFQAFCNDPDRLVAFDPSLLDDNATNLWPPPGFFPNHFAETDPHVEASQILQSLSANDQYPTLPESVGW
ncbi:hypothetical protein EPUS_00435 [Endocarpon pusillum Z07020]|uniref:Zn(2)-C6 fungal-type domain-containing protein n=1 Tax=Endocarpon pusillum (strain Z07020 / HMAS-L-300199) TaxID=1263415 RepID=U1FZ93_ENDPU|nr:uncharacterized protein EPUS_00435 [Endocarpon pusillum Z07020]ERF70247.1 hypothetical protein EPUS_00435 [Endocarpon pusillum Z07020]